ncbi:methyltetrahydrofolate cobalamin methyltransferase [Acetonema longum]|uniref:Methyltetrahydrofolate:corrinoid/iron-sulfur protein methyltransferase n=1 Tax=Acetonema longum DSM 6540 TaxID=1009370 RepID=F7NLQ3_9FIRM|nr:methyltetrahydrofolate cobalamin methyltransferase [Acetonema longum]EGO62994.1 methyltetrahydrofolate:corrinoid/iron-sulfur protein methyltransferase [Acetonema longum DSM 6540]
MLLIGELINTSRKAIREAVEARNSGYIQQVAKEQEEAGAHYLDINCGNMVGQEIEIMKWLVETVQQVTDMPLCIDSPDAGALRTGLSLLKPGYKPMINSISAESKRYEAIVPLIKEFQAKIVALCIEDAGMPATAEDRLRIAVDLVQALEKQGVVQDDIYLDPLIKPLSTNENHGKEVLDAIRLIKEKFPAVHFTCGLSNISYGLPNRPVLNRLFVVQTMTAGMDGYILNPGDKAMMGIVYASQALLGQDKYCSKYLKAHRKGLYA